MFHVHLEWLYFSQQHYSFNYLYWKKDKNFTAWDKFVKIVYKLCLTNFVSLEMLLKMFFLRSKDPARYSRFLVLKKVITEVGFVLN